MPDRTIPHHIVTTEVRQRKTVITLDVVEIHEILQDWALRKVYADPAGTLDRIEVEFNVTPTTDENYDLDATCTVTEDLPIILPTPDEAPTSPNAFRLSHHLPSCICGACLHRKAIQPVPQTDGYAGHPQHNTTAASSRENVDAIERMKEEQPALLKAMDINARYTEIKTGIQLPIIPDMSQSWRWDPADTNWNLVWQSLNGQDSNIPRKTATPNDLWMEDLMKRVNRLHEVLLHGKGNNIVLTKGEVDTLLEYINVGALAVDKVQQAGYAVPPYTTPMNLPLPEGASVLSAARGV